MCVCVCNVCVQWADYVKELQKPLKAPPRGLEWRRHDDGSWELRTIKVKDSDGDGGAQADDVNGKVQLLSSYCLYVSNC